MKAQGGFEPHTRHRSVVGDGPRVEPLPNAQIDQESWDLVNTLRESAGVPPTEQMPVFCRMMAKHPAIFHRQMEMGSTLFSGRISSREREIAVLRISWLAGAAVEWGEHVEIAKRCGLSPAEIEATVEGSTASTWNQHESAILRAVEESLEGYAVSEKTWATLAETWDEAQLIELPMMIGQYLTTAFVLNTLRVPLGEGNRGLLHR